MRAGGGSKYFTLAAAPPLWLIGTRQGSTRSRPHSTDVPRHRSADHHPQIRTQPNHGTSRSCLINNRHNSVPFVTPCKTTTSHVVFRCFAKIFSRKQLSTTHKKVSDYSTSLPVLRTHPGERKDTTQYYAVLSLFHNVGFVWLVAHIQVLLLVVICYYPLQVALALQSLFSRYDSRSGQPRLLLQLTQ
jgi:hypothetical protein